MTSPLHYARMPVKQFHFYSGDLLDGSSCMWEKAIPVFRVEGFSWSTAKVHEKCASERTHLPAL